MLQLYNPAVIWQAISKYWDQLITISSSALEQHVNNEVLRKEAETPVSGLWYSSNSSIAAAAAAAAANSTLRQQNICYYCCCCSPYTQYCCYSDFDATAHPLLIPLPPLCCDAHLLLPPPGYDVAAAHLVLPLPPICCDAAAHLLLLLQHLLLLPPLDCDAAPSSTSALPQAPTLHCNATSINPLYNSEIPREGVKQKKCFKT